MTFEIHDGYAQMVLVKYGPTTPHAATLAKPKMPASLSLGAHGFCYWPNYNGAGRVRLTSNIPTYWRAQRAQVVSLITGRSNGN